MAWGTMGVDWETRVDYDRLRSYRLSRAKEQLVKHNIGAYLCFDFNNIRYITGTHIGEWARDKMHRYAFLPRGGEPILFESGSAGAARRLYSPWIADRVRPAITWSRGGIPNADRAADRLAAEIVKIMIDHGVEKEPLAIDWSDMVVLDALRRAGIKTIIDGQDSLLDARLIKNQDEIQLMKAAASMVDAAYDTMVRSIKPGVKENELVGLACNTLYSLGSDDVECVNVVSGPRSAPHPHVFSDRIIRPGDFVFFDIIHSFNGYRTCYYRSFICGRPTDEQKAAYKQAYDWLYQAIDMVRPGISSKEIALSWPDYTMWGLSSEAEAIGMAIGHGIGLSIHERPFISRLCSLETPFTLQKGMTIAMETYAQTPDKKHGARIEEEILVTEDGHEVITKYPCEELISCGVPKYW
jgi:Xaa-Pro aminopeptidase